MEDESKINTLNIGSGKTPLNSGEMGLDRIFQAGYEIIDGSLFIIADVANLPFKDGYFERVYIDFPDLNIIMTLLENYKQSSFYEIARVLKSGGKMSILIDIDQAGVHASYGQSVH